MSTTVRFHETPGWEHHLEQPIDVLLGKIAGMVEVDAAANAPVDTGELRDSIFSEVQTGVAIVGASAEHAAAVELGTSQMSPQPYLRPALNKKRG